MRAARPFALALALLLGACAPERGDGRAGGGGAVRVTGTTLDAQSGALLAGVRITGPRGLRTVSSPDGRFALEGLAEGEEGELVGRLDDGRTGRVRLRPLSAPRLEVVLRLEHP